MKSRPRYVLALTFCLGLLPAAVRAAGVEISADIRAYLLDYRQNMRQDSLLSKLASSRVSHQAPRAQVETNKWQS